MRIWVEDLKYDLATALRAVGVGLAAVAWASVLGSEAQQPADIRAYVQVGAAVVSVCIVQWLTVLPPSANLLDLLRLFQRDILAVARQRTDGDAERTEVLAARITDLAAERIRGGSNVPPDHRAWLRLLARLAEDRRATEARQSGYELEVNDPRQAHADEKDGGRRQER